MLRVVRLPLAEAADAVRAAWDAGDAVAPLDPRAPPEEHRRDLAAIHADEPVHPDVAAIVTTSGTTGDPRAVELTWDGLRAMAAFIATAPSDRWGLTLPLHRVAGLAVVARAWAQGVPLVEDGATLVSLVPTQVRRLADPSRYRLILVGGGPVPNDIRALPNVVATYGLTETWGGVVHDGHPLPGVEVGLADDGEIAVRTPTAMRGYRGEEPPLPPGVFFRTGDIGEWAPDGRLRVIDRKHDIVITGGVNVSPTEVERALRDHPAIADVCVAGAPDDEWGERVVAYVVPKAGTAPPALADLRLFARPRLSAPKLPREVVVVDAIPRTEGGKPLRRLLRGG